MGDASNYLLSVTDPNQNEWSFGDLNTRDVQHKTLNSNISKVKVVKTSAMEVDEADHNSLRNRFNKSFAKSLENKKQS